MQFISDASDSNSISSSPSIFVPGFTKTSCVQPSLETATDIITEWLNIGRMYTQKTAGTNVTLSGRDGSIHLIVLRVNGGATVKIFSSVKKMEKIDFALSENPAAALTFLTSSYCYKLLKNTTSGFHRVG